MTEHAKPQLPELETAPKPTAAVETLTALSLAVAALSLFLFSWIANNVAHDRTATFDANLRWQIHGFASPLLTKTMIWISFLGSGGLAILAVIALVAFLRLRWRRAALWLGITMLGALVLEGTLKYAFDRPRPPSFFVAPLYTPSFPSGHSLVSFCFYFVMAGLLADRVRSSLLRVLVWVVAALLIFAIGLSRIYLGVHYPSDVIAGYLAATLWVSTMISVDRLRTSRKSRFERPQK